MVNVYHICMPIVNPFSMELVMEADDIIYGSHWHGHWRGKEDKIYSFLLNNLGFFVNSSVSTPTHWTLEKENNNDGPDETDPAANVEPKFLTV
jgi:hypothetical protein